MGMDETIGFVLVCMTLIINISAAIVSSYTLVCLLRRKCRLRDINLLLVINTDIAVLLCSVIQVSLNIHVVLGVSRLYMNIDSIACQVCGYVYLYVISCLLNSFILQAYIRMLNIMHPQRFQLLSFMKILILIVIMYFLSFLIIIPTYFLDVIVYESTEYQCLVDTRMWKGNVYMILSLYSIPTATVVTIYTRVVKFLRDSSSRNQPYQSTKTARDMLVLRHILILVSILIGLGLPSVVLWLQSIFTRKLTSLTYRIQAIFLALDILLLAFTVIFTNPQVKKLLPLLNQRQTTLTITVHL